VSAAPLEPYSSHEQDGDSHSLRLHRLDGAHYVEDAVAKAGETLSVTEPFRWAMDPSALR